VVAIERVSELPAEVAEVLAREADRAGLGFVRRLLEEWASGRNRFDRPGEAFFVARIKGELVGVCGLNVDPYAAAPSVGRVRHLYVLSASRQRGVGARLVDEVVAAARGAFDTLRLRTENSTAARLYERMGFRRGVGIADCTHIMDVS
jgi:GNAT superfamily N-acetyltransferase